MHAPERERPGWVDPVAPAGDLTGLASSRTAWGLAVGLLAVVHLVIVRLGRFPEWDGAVFLSHSGGFGGIDMPAATLVASRELGTPVLLAALRSLNPTLATTRVLWMLVAFLVLLVALRRLGALLGFPAPVAVVVLGTYWLSIEFASSFLSFFLAGTVMLAATAWYLDLRRAPDGQIARGLGLGAALAACLWLRQAEGALFVALLGLHAVAVRPSLLWAGRWRGLVAATNAFLLLFVIPWSIDSTVRFGSVPDRIDAARNQSFDRGASLNVGDYLGILRGDSHLYGDAATPADWALVLLTALLVVGVVVGLACGVALARRSRRSPEAARQPLSGLALLWLVGVGFVGFFVVYINHVSDKYMVIGGLFLLLAVVATTWRFLVSRPATGRTPTARRPAAILAVVALLAAWVVPNAVVANTYEVARFEAGRVLQQNGAVIRSLAGTENCFGVSRYRAPLVRFATGCRTRSAKNPAEVAEAFDRRAGNHGTEDFWFVLWPERAVGELREVLGDGFRTLPLPSRPDRTQWVLVHRNGVDT